MIKNWQILVVLAGLWTGISNPLKGQFLASDHWIDWQWQRGNIAAGAVYDVAGGLLAKIHGGHCMQMKQSALQRLVFVEVFGMGHDLIHHYHIAIFHPEQTAPPQPKLRDAFGYAVGWSAGEVLRLVWNKVF